MIKTSLFFSKRNSIKQALKQINITDEKYLIIVLMTVNLEAFLIGIYLNMD